MTKDIREKIIEIIGHNDVDCEKDNTCYCERDYRADEILSVVREEYRGQTKRIWYQRGHADGKREALEELLKQLPKEWESRPVGTDKNSFDEGYNQAISEVKQQIIKSIK